MKKRLLSTFMALLMVCSLCIYFPNGIIVSADGFTPRTTAPSTSNSYYYSDNPFYQSGYGMPNCTCYAYGRAWELLGSKPNLSTGNAGKWYWYNKDTGIYSYGSTPKLGAIACWDKYDKNQGHVAVVEAINGDTITISESHYNGTNFDTRNIASNSSNYLTSMRFCGYIYIGEFGGNRIDTEVDNSYNKNVACTAPSQINTYDVYGNRESNRWVSAGDSCIAIEAYTNGYWKIDYPASGSRRIAYMKLSEWNPFANTILPGTVDTNYKTNISCTAPSQINTYDANGNRESNRWVDAGDSCIAIEAYTNGYWKIDYPAGSTRRIAYMKLSEWNPFTNAWIVDTRYNTNVSCTAPSQIHTYDSNGNQESNRWVDPGDSCIAIEAYTNGFWKIDYPAGSVRRIAYMKLSEWNPFVVHTHSYTSKVTKEATCTVSGVCTYSCSCGDNYTETIPATGHKYTVNTVAPTTTAMGYDLHTCTVCNYSFKDNYTDIIHTHSYTSKVTKEATCTVSGVCTYSCSCGDNYTETIPATGHKYTVKTIAPTTAAMGYDLHTCSVCKYSYKDNYTDSIPSSKVPELTATATEEKVTLKWKPIANAEKYGIAGYTNGKWNLLDECYTISYELKNLKPGTKYKVAVVAMFDGKWNMDFSNAVTVALKESTIPKITYEKGNGSVKLTWTSVSGAEKYGIFEFEDDYWNRIAQTTDTSYVLTGLASGSEHKIAVVTYSNGKWNTDFSNAVIVSPNAPQPVIYPKVSSIDHSEEFHQFRVKWSAVPNAQQYGIAVKLSGKWKIQKTFDAKTTTFTSPKLTAGKTYEMVICAKINGEWDTSKLSGRIFKVTVK